MSGPQRSAGVWTPARVILLFASSCAILFAIFRPALEGRPVSDDFLYVFSNFYVLSLTPENLRAIFDPFGGASEYFLHYNPLQHLLHALEIRVFGKNLIGYHAVNVVLHALNVMLLVALLVASRIPFRAALLGGAFFAFHPANVEPVAWISQLKTLASMTLVMGAVLTHRARPALGPFLFALALFAKISAVAALPMAAALTWARRGQPGGGARHWAWLGAWALVMALWWIPSAAAGVWTGDNLNRYPTLWIHVGSMADYAARYLIMAVSSHGVAAFHDPAPSTPLAAWALAGFAAALLIGWRTWLTLRRRSEEAAFWILALASWAPISQILPFAYPMGDRYLYTILPGLIGGSLLLGIDVLPRLRPRLEASGVQLPSRAALGRAAALGVAVLCVWFGVRSHARAALWTDLNLLLADSASHYPDSGTAHYLAARRAAQRGDVDAALRELREAEKTSLVKIKGFYRDPWLKPIAADPAYQAYVREFAGNLIEFANRSWPGSIMWIQTIAEAHQVRGEYDAAIELLERGIRWGGPYRDQMLAQLELVQVERRRARYPAAGSGDSPEKSGGAKSDPAAQLLRDLEDKR